MKGETNRKLQAMTTSIVSITAEQFGKEEEKGSRTPYSKNQKAARIHIRQEMKALNPPYKETGEDERICLA